MPELLTRKQIEDMSRCQEKPDCTSCSLFDQAKNDFINTECDIDNVAQTALTLLNMLKRLEFANLTFEGEECYICAGNEGTGHKPDCELGNLLKEMEVEHGTP
ncbi:MAG: hypothetical protein AWM53_01999 [Candidatus Dichloromethanomonas elyunquensis]|nr:MAG: hypothetical protein AWM53_01999 [Candidatus Dichloromethanomonas elyunquensis]